MYGDAMTWQAFLPFCPVFSSLKWPVMHRTDVFFVVKMIKLLNRFLCYQCFDTQWQSCQIIALCFLKYIQTYSGKQKYNSYTYMYYSNDYDDAKPRFMYPVGCYCLQRKAFYLHIESL